MKPIRFQGLPGADPKGWWHGDLAFSPDGKTLASGGNDHVIRLWDSATGGLLREMRGHERAVGHLHFTPDGEFLISASTYSVRLWEVESGEELNQWRDAQSINSLAFSPNSSAIAVADWSGLFIRDLEQDRPIPINPDAQHGVSYVAAYPDGEFFATVSSVSESDTDASQTVALWSPRYGRTRTPARLFAEANRQVGISKWRSYRYVVPW